MARKEITMNSLAAELREARKQYKRADELIDIKREEGERWRRKASKLEEELKESARKLDGTERQLERARIEIAERRGYLQRVNEEDRVRDGLPRFEPEEDPISLGERVSLAIHPSLLGT